MSLLYVLKKNPVVRRLFGKRELVIIEKQLMGVKLKPSETTRLSRDIRKKLEAVKALAAFSSHFQLKKGSEVKRLVKETIEIMRESRFFPRIKQVFLFGSASDGSMALVSDIDLAVIFGEISENESALFRAEVLGKASDRLDVQVFNTLPEKLKKEITLKGKSVYEKDKRKD